MALSLEDYAAESSIVEFPFGTHTISVEYNPVHVTDELSLKMNAVMTKSEQELEKAYTALYTAIAPIIKSWDIFLDSAQKKMFPIDPAQFSKLPQGLILAVFEAIMKDIRPNK